MDRPPEVRFSPNFPVTSSTAKDETTELQDNSGCPSLAKAGVVPSDSRSPDPLTQPVTKFLHPDPDSLHLCAWMLSNLTSEQLAFQKTLLPWQPRVDVLQSEENMTIAFYNITSNGRMVQQERFQSPFCIFNRGWGFSSSPVLIRPPNYNQICGYRSAIGVIHRGFDDNINLSNNTSIAHLLKGMFVDRPPTKRLTPSWDLGRVLLHLSKFPFRTSWFMLSSSADSQNSLFASSLHGPSEK